MRLLIALLFLQASAAASAQDWSSVTCGASLGHAYGFFSPRPDDATQGDFNGDGTPDFALLMEAKAAPHRAAVGVCLSNEPRPLLITSPYQSAKISTKPKGTAYVDLDTGSSRVFERDAISVSDGARIGASYILRVGVFVQVIDSD